jgi:hypothetical protein
VFGGRLAFFWSAVALSKLACRSRCDDRFRWNGGDLKILSGLSRAFGSSLAKSPLPWSEIGAENNPLDMTSVSPISSITLRDFMLLFRRMEAGKQEI